MQEVWDFENGHLLVKQNLSLIKTFLRNLLTDPQMAQQGSKWKIGVLSWYLGNQREESEALPSWALYEVRAGRVREGTKHVWLYFFSVDFRCPILGSSLYWNIWRIRPGVWWSESAMSWLLSKCVRELLE